MPDIVTVRGLRKSYAGGFEALKGVSLAIREGEILALLGPNGAGKTTLISAICGIVPRTSGRIEVGGHDIVRDWRAARSLIGLVPQEISLEPFEKVVNTVRFTRGLFGKPPRRRPHRGVLRQLSLWDKRDSKVMELSGGMKRRVLIAKALSHEPRVLFLDEPSAGVDVELRRDMWHVVRRLQADGVTIILTTHYIEEAEAIADRVGVIARGEILLVEEKASLMRRMGQKELHIDLSGPSPAIPRGARAASRSSSRRTARRSSTATTPRPSGPASPALLAALTPGGDRRCATSRPSRPSLEDIFVGLVREGGMNLSRVQAIYRHEMGRFFRTPLAVADRRRCSRPRSTSWSSARRSAGASRRSRACPTAPSSCRASSCCR